MLAKFKSVIGILCTSTLMLIAAGCSSNPDPTESSGPSLSPTTTLSGSPSTPPPSATAKPTPAPVPASSKGPAKNWPVPKLPEAAKEKSENGLKVFAKFYYELVEYTIETNDTKPIKQVTKHTCVECSTGFIDPFDNNKKAGSWLAGADFEINVTKSILQPNNGVVLYTSAQGEMVAYMSDGTRQGVFPASDKPFPATMLTDWDDGWSVESLEYLDVK